MPERRKSRVVTAGNVKIGGNNHIPVQSMLNIPAEDAEGNVKQALELQKAGCEIIRLTVPNKEAVKTLAAVKEKVRFRLLRTYILTTAARLRALRQVPIKSV